MTWFKVRQREEGENFERDNLNIDYERSFQLQTYFCAGNDLAHRNEFTQVEKCLQISIRQVLILKMDNRRGKSTYLNLKKSCNSSNTCSFHSFNLFFVVIIVLAYF